MGNKTDTAMLPPESARAIYTAIEIAAEANRQLIAQQNKRIDEQGRLLEKIADGVDHIRGGMSASAVRLEHHSGEIRRIDGEVSRIATTVSDVESDVLRIKPKVLGTTPTAPLPATRASGSATVNRRSDDDRDAPIVTVRVQWRKIFNSAIIAGVSALVTLGVPWLMERAAHARQSASQIVPASAHEAPKKIEPMPAQDIQDIGP